MATAAKERDAMILARVREHLPEAEHGDRRATIMAAAMSVFLREGFAGAGMGAIAAEAGVSKQTVYSHFGSKEALFTAMLTSLCERGIPVDSFDRVPALPPAEGLTEFARIFLGGILSPHALALARVLITESQRAPELGEMFYRTGPRRIRFVLEGYLARLHGAGLLRVNDPSRAAEVFLALLTGPVLLPCLLGIEDETTITRREQVIEAAVSAFLQTADRI